MSKNSLLTLNTSYISRYTKDSRPRVLAELIKGNYKENLNDFEKIFRLYRDCQLGPESLLIFIKTLYGDNINSKTGFLEYVDKTVENELFSDEETEYNSSQSSKDEKAAETEEEMEEIKKLKDGKKEEIELVKTVAEEDRLPIRTSSMVQIPSTSTTNPSSSEPLTKRQRLR